MPSTTGRKPAVKAASRQKTPAKMSPVTVTPVKTTRVRKPRGGQAAATGISDAQVLTLLEARAARARCGAKLRGSTDEKGKWDGSRCPQPAGFRTPHKGYGRCVSHGGTTPSGLHHGALLAARAEAEAVRDAQRFYGSPRKVTPEQALWSELHRTAGIVDWLSEMVAKWGLTDERAELERLLDPSPDFSDDEIDAARAKTESWHGDTVDYHEYEDDGTLTVEHGVHPRNPATGLPDLVAVHTTTKAVGFTDTEYAAWRKVLIEERKHLAQVAKMCLDAGIEERVAQALEARSLMMVKVMLRVGERMGMKLGELEMRGEIQSALREVLSVVPTQRVVEA